MYICSALILCNLWFILLKGLPPILSQLSQFVLDLVFQQILTAHFICITLRTMGRWIKIQQTLSLGNLQLNREYQNVHLIITQNNKRGSVSDKVYRSWEEGEAMWKWMRIDFVCIVGIQVGSWRRGNVRVSIYELYTCYYPHFIRMKPIKRKAISSHHTEVTTVIIIPLPPCVEAGSVPWGQLKVGFNPFLVTTI